MIKRPRQHDEKHLAFIRSLPCVVCKNNIETEAAHIRMMDPTVAKPMTGIGQKPHDKYTLPLCGKCHREQHAVRENQFWERAGIDPVKLALELYSESGDFERGEQVVNASR